ADDGIRDDLVTGVQTCALPIFASLKKANIARPKDFEGKRYGSFGSPTEKALIGKLMQADGGDVQKVEFVEIGDTDFLTLAQKGRSEERRVGEEMGGGRGGGCAR